MLILNLAIDVIIVLYVLMVVAYLSSRNSAIKQELESIEELVEINLIYNTNRDSNTNRNVWR